MTDFTDQTTQDLIITSKKEKDKFSTLNQEIIIELKTRASVSNDLAAKTYLYTGK